MSEATVRGGFDTYVDSAASSRENYGAKFLRLKTSADYAFIYFRVPAPRGSTVASATLHVFAHGASSGSRTLTASRVADSWKAAQTNWSNKPGVTGSGATASVGTLADGDEITFDVTAHVQAVVSGAAHYGWRITSDASTLHSIYGLDSGDSKPYLTVSWSDAPATPTSLSPSDGGIVSIAKPTLQFDYTDVSEDPLQGLQVQIDASANGSSPGFDSGTVSTAEPELDLTTTAYSGLSNGSTTQWRVRVQDSGGLWSGWSDWTSFTRTNKLTLAIDNPAASPNDFVTEATPPVLWSVSGGTQAFFRVRITNANDRSNVRYDSGKRKSATGAHTLPKGVLKDSRTYSLNVQVWDSVTGRAATPGDPVYTDAWRDFTVDDDGATATITSASLVAAQLTVTPWVRLTWARSTAPDSWIILRDGKVIDSNVDVADTTTSGTAHAWTDYTADPNVSHDYNVKAVVNGKQSGPGSTASVTTSPSGLWLVDPDRGISVTLWGDDEGSWDMPDDATVYRPLGSDETVRIVSGMGGLVGTLTGYLMEGFGKSFAAMESDLYSIKERPTETVRIIAADMNFRALIGDVRISPRPLTRNGHIVKAVSLNFWQTGDLPFEPRL